MICSKHPSLSPTRHSDSDSHPCKLSTPLGSFEDSVLTIVHSQSINSKEFHPRNHAVTYRAILVDTRYWQPLGVVSMRAWAGSLASTPPTTQPSPGPVVFSWPPHRQRTNHLSGPGPGDLLVLHGFSVSLFLMVQLQALLPLTNLCACVSPCASRHYRTPFWLKCSPTAGAT